MHRPCVSAAVFFAVLVESGYRDSFRFAGLGKIKGERRSIQFEGRRFPKISLGLVKFLHCLCDLRREFNANHTQLSGRHPDSMSREIN